MISWIIGIVFALACIFCVVKLSIGKDYSPLEGKLYLLGGIVSFVIATALLWSAAT